MIPCFLKLLPLEERLVGAVDVEAGVVGVRDQLADIVALVADRAVVVLDRVLPRLPVGHVGGAGLAVRHRDPAEHDVAHVPGLGVEHVERVPLVLHAEIEQLRIVDPDHALVEIRGRQPVGRLEAQLRRHEGEMVQIAGAQDDGVDIRRGAVLEGAGVSLHPLQERHLLPVVRPVIAHRRGPVAGGDRLAAVFPALRADILGRVAGADDQDVLVLEFHGVAKIVGMQDPAVEVVEAVEMRHVGGREMTRRDDDVVEILAVLPVRREVVSGDPELAGPGVVGDPPDRAAETDPVAHARLPGPTGDVVEQHLARRVGRDLPAEMLLEGIVREFQPFLGAVRPQVTVHGAMDRLAIFVEPRPPSIVPEPAPVGLLLVADDLGNLRSAGLRRLERPQLGEAGRPRADHRNPFGHVLAPRPGRRSGSSRIPGVVLKFPSAGESNLHQSTPSNTIIFRRVGDFHGPFGPPRLTEFWRKPGSKAYFSCIQPAV